MYQQNFTNFYFNKRGTGTGNATSGKFGSAAFGVGTKKAVKHFTDLEVYQKALEASVFVAKNICRPTPEIDSSSESKGLNGTASGENVGAGTTQKCRTISALGRSALGQNSTERKIGIGTNEYIIKNMTALALSIPHLIAEAHSSRFGSSEQCLLILDKVMLNCNKMVVYLDQTRDICETGIELEQFEEQIKKYFFIRQKVLNLQRVWKKYIDINKQERGATDIVRR